MVGDEEFLIVGVAAESLSEELGASCRGGVGEREITGGEFKVEEKFVVFKEEGHEGEVLEGVLVEGGTSSGVGEVLEQVFFENDGDEYVLGQRDELQFDLVLTDNQVEHLHTLQVLGAEVFEDLLDDLRLEFGRQTSLVLLLEHTFIDRQ